MDILKEFRGIQVLSKNTTNHSGAYKYTQDIQLFRVGINEQHEKQVAF
jgi:hypothetical protein